jgi:hypothetical protein
VGALAVQTVFPQEEECVAAANAHSAEESGAEEQAPAGWALVDYSARRWVDGSARHDSAVADYSVGPSAECSAPAGWVLGDYSAGL